MKLYPLIQEPVEEQGIAQYARSPDRVIPGDAAKDHEYMCLIGVPLCKISINWGVKLCMYSEVLLRL